MACATRLRTLAALLALSVASVDALLVSGRAPVHRSCGVAQPSLQRAAARQQQHAQRQQLQSLHWQQQPRSAQARMGFQQGGFGGPGGPPRFPQGGRGPQFPVWPLVLVALAGTGTLGFAFNLLNGLFLLFFLVPLVAGPLFQWYISANTVEGACPECGAPMQLMKNSPGVCYQCGASMSADLDPSGSGIFMRTGKAGSQYFPQEDGVVDIDVLDD